MIGWRQVNWERRVSSALCDDNTVKILVNVLRITNPPAKIKSVTVAMPNADLEISSFKEYFNS